jgi:Ca2+:H+ antiporter
MQNKIGKFFLFMLVFIPISYFAAYTENKLLTAFTAILAIIPLARIIGFATKEIALQTNPSIGGLVNATFGNIIELLIAVFALHRGLIEIVKASVIGSIIGNILLLIGMSIFFGGLKFKEQKFNKDSAGVSSTMLIIAVAGLAIPTVYAFTAKPDVFKIQILSNAVALVLSFTYILSLFFAFFTHKHLFDASDDIKASKEKPTITRKMAVIILLIVTVAVAIESEILVRYIEHAATSIGLTQTFIGVVIIAIVTNIAEKANAIHFALENKLDISLEIGMSSAIQIALFVIPILVFISHIFNYGFTLVFSFFEIISMVFAVMIINYLLADGRCNWLEGVQLMSVYLIIAVAFYFI